MDPAKKRNFLIQNRFHGRSSLSFGNVRFPLKTIFAVFSTPF